MKSKLEKCIVDFSQLPYVNFDPFSLTMRYMISEAQLIVDIVNEEGEYIVDDETGKSISQKDLNKLKRFVNKWEKWEFFEEQQ